LFINKKGYFYMKKLVVSIVSAAALATAGMAAASTSTVAIDQNSGSSMGAAGIYVDGGLGIGTISAKGSTYALPVNSLNTTYLAWNGDVGYQFNQYVAVEGGYTSFGHVKANFDNSNSLTTTLGGFGVDAKGILPINPKLSVFGKAGAIDMHESFDTASGEVSSAKNTGNAWTADFGAGVAYNFTHQIAFTAQDIYALKTSENTNNGTANIPAANAVLAGASYKFNI
jgi:OOP family OmpA-OmpF porin